MFASESIQLYRLPMGLAANLLVAATLLAASPVPQAGLPLQVLASIFPGTEVERIPGRTEDSSLRIDNRRRLVFPDALAGQPLYRVSGPPIDPRERCAAADLPNRQTRLSREVRFRLFFWPGSIRQEILAIVQYRFAGAEPSAACTSIGALVRLAPSGKNWTVEERYLLDSARHHQIEGVQLTRVTGTGDEQLVIESDSGDASRFASNLLIFDLSSGHFVQLLNVPSRVYSELDAQEWTQVLDIPRTLTQPGGRFCFVKTLYAADHRWLDIPLVTMPWLCTGRRLAVAGRSV